MNSAAVEGKMRERTKTLLRETPRTFAPLTLAVVSLLCFGQTHAQCTEVSAIRPPVKPAVELAPDSVQKAIGKLGEACASWLATSQTPGSSPTILEEPAEKICRFVAEPTGAEYRYLLTGALALVAALVPIGLLLGFFWAAFRMGSRWFRQLLGARLGEASWRWRT